MTDRRWEWVKRAGSVSMILLCIILIWEAAR
jgi:hypothetical protein